MKTNPLPVVSVVAEDEGEPRAAVVIVGIILGVVLIYLASRWAA
jgi:hypothetical protein